MSKKTMTLNLTEAEMSALEALCTKKELSKTGVLRQALRLYQMVDGRLERGDKLFFEDEIPGRALGACLGSAGGVAVAVYVFKPYESLAVYRRPSAGGREEQQQ